MQTDKEASNSGLNHSNAEEEESKFQELNSQEAIDMDSKSSSSQDSDLDSDDEYHPENSSIAQQSSYGESQSSSSRREKYHAVCDLTQNFMKTFKNVSHSEKLKNGVLATMSIKEIQQMIRAGRQQRKRMNIEIKKPQASIIQQNISKKRTFAQSDLPLDEIKTQKRQKKSSNPQSSTCDFSLAATLIQNFSSLDQELQMKLLSAVDQVINSDHKLLHKALDKQIASHIKDARDFYEKKQLQHLIELLNQLSPMAAILINLQISLVNQELQEESNTLSQTLLPYVNRVRDYSFLPKKSNFIMNRFLSSLIQHLKDTNGAIEDGFMIFAFKHNPILIQQIVQFQNNSMVLCNTLKSMSFSEESATLICKNPKKFLWPELLSFFDGKTECQKNEMIIILSKMDIMNDPGSQMNNLYNLFASRRIFIDQLIKVEKISLSIPQLIIVLETLRPMESQTIIDCFKQDSKLWIQLANQNQSKHELVASEIPNEKLISLFEKFTSRLDSKVNIQEIAEISKEISNEFENYKHCEYQSTISSIIVSHNHPFIIVSMPTGSGKTWIQGIIAKYYCLQGKRVSIIEPNETLKQQTSEKLSLIDYAINICTLQQFYQYGNQSDIVIIDEYDSIFNSQPYFIFNSQLYGVWQLKQQHVIAFSATSQQPVERLVNNCIARPLALKFMSEYEFINGVSPIQDGNIVVCGTYEKMIDQLRDDVVKNYDLKPIIIIYDDQQLQDIIDILKLEKLTYYDSQHSKTLEKIKNLDYGILLLHKIQSRGVDTRFVRDALVLITAKVDSLSEYQQMIGRSSRTRNVCESKLYNSSDESASQTMQRLKRYNINELQELERFLRFLEEKCKDKQLLQFLKESQENQIMMKSLQDLENGIGKSQFERLMKNYKQ